MTTPSPFDILLQANQENAQSFYHKTLKEVGSSVTLSNEVEFLKQRLLRCAFAYLCMDYIHHVEGVYPHDDIPLFIEEMQLASKSPHIYYLFGQENIKWEINTSPKPDKIDAIQFEELMLIYKQWWATQIRHKYADDLSIVELFGENIFGNDAPDGVKALENAMSFVSNNF